MCGGNIQPDTEKTFGTCEYCGSINTLPKVNEERIVNLFNRANHFRRLNEFDKALGMYESILAEDGSNAEAHWGVVLCRYGIEYVEDPKPGRRVPTCHRAQYASILTDADFLAALENAPDYHTKGLYEEEAKAINDIQKGILAIAGNEEPFDVFICYKETAESGTRTIDSTLAQDIYYQLTNDGFKVFFAKITLEDKLGREYEPYIFSALNSAKVMLVIGTKKEYFEAVWVKNEWGRYLAIMKNDRSRLLIPCYRDMDPYDLPDELAHLQAQDMSRIGFMQDIIRGVKKVVGKDEPSRGELRSSAEQPATIITTAAPSVESLMTRGHLTLEDGHWNEAHNFFDRVLDIDAKHAPAYIGKLCVELKYKHKEDLANHETTLENMPNYQKAVRFADEEYKAKIEGYNQAIVNRSLEEHYNKLVLEKHIASFSYQYKSLAQQFRGMNGYKDTVELANECDALALEVQYNGLLQDKDKASTATQYQSLAKQFRDMGSYKDSIVYAEECERIIEKVDFHKEKQYDKLIQDMESVSYVEEGSRLQYLRSLANDFRALGGYKDSNALAEECERLGLKSSYDELCKKKKCVVASAGYLRTLASDFRALNGYKDSNAMAEECERAALELEKREKEQRRQEEEEARRECIRQWKQQGLCPHCGGQFGGLFTKKCKLCGKPQP
jgi:hypothetical protein